MRSIKQQNFCQNIPGFLKLYAAYKSDISILTQVNENSVMLEMEEGKEFGEIDCKKISLSNQYNDGTFNLEINAFIIFTSEYLDKFLLEMTNEEFIVILKDRNEVHWVAGTLDEPLKFSFVHFGEENIFGKHGYAITFFRKMQDPLLVLNGESNIVLTE